MWETVMQICVVSVPCKKLPLSGQLTTDGAYDREGVSLRYGRRMRLVFDTTSYPRGLSAHPVIPLSLRLTAENAHHALGLGCW